jgi:orotate phosphoribosyltransferase
VTSWTEAVLGARLAVTPTRAWAFGDPVELGLRHNPKRAQLLVSRLLGKHIPVPVGDVVAAGEALGQLVRAACAGESPVVVGFAETATALGHAVAAAIGYDGLSRYLHTTRRPFASGHSVLRFLEEHSHAVDQALAIDSMPAPGPDVPLVLVDDELTTGTSAVNAIRALQQVWPRHRYVLASLVDSRSPEQRAANICAVRELGADLVSVALYDAELYLPPDVLRRAAAVSAGTPPRERGVAPAAPISHLQLQLPPSTRSTASSPWGGAAEAAARAAAAECAERLQVARNGRTLVLGDEEFMYLPQLVAAALGPDVLVSATTRSPAVVIDTPGYPLRTGLTFAATGDPNRPAYAYNVARSDAPTDRGNAPGFDDIVFVTDSALEPHVHPGVITQLAASARVGVTVVSVATSC